jgi:hypothetical protein
MASNREIIEKAQRDAAYTEATERAELVGRIRSIIAPTSGSYVTEVTTIDDDTHVVAVADRAGHRSYTVVHNSRNDSIYWPTLDAGIIHAVVTRAGDDTHGVTTRYAARVIGISAG